MENRNLTLACLPRHSAIEISWKHPFQGIAAVGLWEHIKAHYDPQDRKVYAHYTSIVQSLGMGKSRTVGELAHFIIPLNLESTGPCGLRSSTQCVNIHVRVSSCGPQRSRLVNFYEQVIETAKRKPRARRLVRSLQVSCSTLIMLIMSLAVYRASLHSSKHRLRGTPRWKFFGSPLPTVHV